MSAPESIDKHPVRSLFIFLAAGAAIFAGGFSVIIWSASALGGLRFDPSINNFYPWMVGVGALFGFERWWYNESGGVNPFHDR